MHTKWTYTPPKTEIFRVEPERYFATSETDYEGVGITDPNAETVDFDWS